MPVVQPGLSQGWLKCFFFFSGATSVETSQLRSRTSCPFYRLFDSDIDHLRNISGNSRSMESYGVNQFGVELYNNRQSYCLAVKDFCILVIFCPQIVC